MDCATPDAGGFDIQPLICRQQDISIVLVFLIPLLGVLLKNRIGIQGQARF